MNSLTINSNLSSLLVQHSLNKSTNALNLAIERMTTGYKINSAKDDAAGYAVASRMMVDLSSYDVAKNNAGMGLSLLETANKSMDLIGEHLQRIRDLVTEASNGTYDTDSLNAIQAEINARQSEIDRLISSTEYNGIGLFGATEGVTGSFLVDVVQLSADEATDQGYTLVTNAQELKDALGNNEDICLMNDIDLSGCEWDYFYYDKTFEGNGYTISNLSRETSDANNNGLIHYLDSGGVIKNVTIKNATITHGKYSDSGIVVGSNYGTIENVSVVGGSVTFRNVATSSDAYTGGIVGGNHGIIKNSWTSASVIGASGGPYGMDRGGVVNNSYNSGDIDLRLGSYDTSSDITEEQAQALLIPPTATVPDITLKIGIDTTSNSEIAFNTGFNCEIAINVLGGDFSAMLSEIDNAISNLTTKQTELGAVSNRLNSVINQLDINLQNVTSSLSTVKDADVAKVSADYIKQQILQNASSTLLATANQSPSIALQLI